MAVLAVREYERIQCGAVFDPATRVITEAQHRVLERFAEDYKRKFKVNVLVHGPRRSLVAQNFVGIINLGRDQIEVLPKIECETSQVRKNLAAMIASVLKLELLAGGSSQVDKSNDSILEILIRLFCDQLWQAVRRGMVRQYERRHENLTVLRGRLSVSAQIRLNLARPERLACEFDEFNENNPLNQLIKAALQVLQKVARAQANQRNVSELLFCFQDVEDVTPDAINLDLISTDRLTVRYQPILEMAKLFIKGRSPDVISGGSTGFALLFDMNELFESYIGVVARRVFGQRGMTVHLQGPKRHLAQHGNGTPVFELRPDIVVSSGGTVAFIIDTKWKRLKELANREGVASGDVYQMYAYSSRYIAPDVVLLYPHHMELGTWKARRAEYWLHNQVESSREDQRCVAVATVDLRDLATVPAQLELVFPQFHAHGLFQTASPAIATDQ